MKTSFPRRLADLRPAALGLAICAAFATVPAAAQDVSVYVDSFTWTTSTGEDLVWTDPYQLLATQALNGGGLFGSDSDMYEVMSYLPAIGFASTTHGITTFSSPGDQTFYLTAATTRGNYPVGTPRNEAAASALNSGGFTLLEGGTVTFNVGYTLAVNKAGGNASTDFSAAFLHFNAMSDDGTSGGDLTRELFSFAQLSGMGSVSGTFSLTVSLIANQIGYYTLDGRAESYAAAVTPIPEPETWALMLAGLAGLGAVARRRRPATA